MRGTLAQHKSKLESHVPNGLIKLKLVRPDGALPFEYYIAHPVQPGPQPVLWVRRTMHDVTFPNRNGYIPKRLRAYLRSKKSRPVPLPITFPVRGFEFNASVSVLPAQFPGARDILERSAVLRVAFSLVALSYANELECYRTTLAGKVPKSTAEPPFRTHSDRKLVRVVRDIFRNASDEHHKQLAIQELAGPASRATQWRLWHLVEGLRKQGQESRWKILRRWPAWEELSLTWPERHYDSLPHSQRNCSSCFEVEETFGPPGATLSRMCRRMGLWIGRK